MIKFLCITLCGLSLVLISSCSVNQGSAGSSTSITSSAITSVSDPSISQTSSTFSNDDLVFETTWKSPVPSAETSETGSAKPLITLDAPSGWSRIEDSFFLEKLVKGSATFLISEESFFSDSNLEHVISESKQMLTGVFDEVVFEGEVDSRSIDGNEGQHFLMTCLVNGVPVTTSYTYLSIDGKVYSFILSETSDIWPEISAEEDALFSGVSIQ